MKACSDIPAEINELPYLSSFQKQLKNIFEGLDSEIKVRIPGKSALAFSRGEFFPTSYVSCKSVSCVSCRHQLFRANN